MLEHRAYAGEILASFWAKTPFDAKSAPDDTQDRYDTSAFGHRSHLRQAHAMTMWKAVGRPRRSKLKRPPEAFDISKQLHGTQQSRTVHCMVEFGDGLTRLNWGKFQFTLNGGSMIRLKVTLGLRSLWAASFDERRAGVWPAAATQSLLLEVDLGTQPTETPTPVPPTPTAAPTAVPTDAPTAVPTLDVPIAVPRTMTSSVVHGSADAGGRAPCRRTTARLRRPPGFGGCALRQQEPLRCARRRWLDDHRPGAATAEDSLESFGIDSPFNWKSQEQGQALAARQRMAGPRVAWNWPPPTALT